MMPTQIHFNCQQPTPDKFKLEERFSDSKPFTAFWSSTVCDEWGSDWLRFLHERNYKHTSIEDINTTPYEIKPVDGINIFTINDEEDVAYLRFHYGDKSNDYYSRRREEDILWDRVAKDYQAVRNVDYGLLDAWDCDSTAWLDWDAFTVTPFEGSRKIVQLMWQHIEDIHRENKLEGFNRG